MVDNKNSGNPKDSGKAEDFLQVFKRGVQFTEELLAENERLRYRVVRLEEENRTLAQQSMASEAYEEDVEYHLSIPFGPSTAPAPSEKPVVCFYLYQVQPSTEHQVQINPIVRERSSEGRIIEYQQGRPLFLTLRFLYTVFAQDLAVEQVLMAIGMRAFHDFPKVNEENAVGSSIHVEDEPDLRWDPDFTLETQKLVWSTIGLPYRPAVGYKIDVRLDSSRKTLVRRVRERIIDFTRLEP